MADRPFRHRLAAIGLFALAMCGAALVAVQAPVQSAHAANPASPADPSALGGPPTIRRLSEEQYRRSIEDVFGSGIVIPGRFEPVLREEGLLAIGESGVNVSASGLEQYELRARQIAAQVTSEARRKTLIDCTPASPAAFDAACAQRVLVRYGQSLYRRPLTKGELASVMALAGAATGKTQSFYRGLEFGLARLLYSPNFIFRIERSEPDAARPGRQRLDSWSLASRISFLLWNAPPDAELQALAANGSLHRPEVLEAQVDRMIASPRFATGVRAFFADMLGFSQFDGLTKDQAVFRKFTSAVANDAREQVLRTVVNQLVTEKGDYRDLFVTRKTFLNRNLGALYEIPIDDGAGVEGWVPYTFDETERRGGIVTLAGIMMLDPTHEGRSSPTNRGKFVREALMCQTVPAPPANVNFTQFQDTASRVHPTARERLKIHQENPVCAGCHAITDPIGLAMENYDAVGAYRLTENGARIDPSGTFLGKRYNDAIELGRVLRESPAIPACVVKRSYEYGVGRKVTPAEATWLEQANEAFAKDQYRFAPLMRRIATSASFRAVSNPLVAAR